MMKPLLVVKSNSSMFVCNQIQYHVIFIVAYCYHIARFDGEALLQEARQVLEEQPSKAAGGCYFGMQYLGIPLGKLT